MTKLKIFILGLSLILFSDCSTYQVSHISEANSDASNAKLYYALPKMVFDLKVNYKVTKFSRNKYLSKLGEKKYAKIVSAIQGFKYYSTDKSKTSINKIELVPVILPDTSQIYAIELKRVNNVFIDKKFLFEFNEKGALTSTTIETQNLAPLFIKETVNLASNIALGLVGFSEDNSDKTQSQWESELKKVVSTILELEKRILKLQLTTNKDNVGKIALIENLQKQRNDLISEIKGKKSEKEHIYTRSINPEDCVGTDLELFHVSSSGIGGKGERKKIYLIDIQPVNNSLTFKNHLNQVQSNSSAKNQGIYYRNPLYSRVRILEQNKVGDIYETFEIYNQFHSIPQLGTVAFLPTKVGLFKNKFTYVLHPETGALLKFDATGNAVDSSIINALYGNAGKQSNRLIKGKDQFEEDQNELKHLKNQLEKLQLQQQIDSLILK